MQEDEIARAQSGMEPSEVAVPPELAAVVGGHPLVARTLTRRGLSDPGVALAFLDPTRYVETPAGAMSGMGSAVARIERAIRAGESVCVWGDFDVDGQTATALLVSTLRSLGARVSYHVPLRETEGHGVGQDELDRVIDAGAQLIVTCDTGISARDAVAHARARGADFIVTDHHDLPGTPPDCVVINPKLLPAGHPLVDLPGVGVAYKLAEALCERRARPEIARASLDLVALGVVADLAVLARDTRYLLQLGLEALRATVRPGLLALMDSAEVEADWLTEEHIGFELGPRLNAVGRLADAARGVELLTTGDPALARILAGDFENLNARRKRLCDQVFEAALGQIAASPALLDEAALVLFGPAWHPGVVGIVASRLVDRYGRPVLLIAAPDGGPARGSARSVEGCHITDAIATCGELLLGYGGHPMAAGFSLDADNIPAFRRRLCRAVADHLTRSGRAAGRALNGVDITAGVKGPQVDGFLGLGELTLELVADLDRLSPYGPGNPPLTLLARSVWIDSRRTVGRDGAHLLLQVKEDSGATQKVIWWNGAGEALPSGRFDLAYRAGTSAFQGQREIRVTWVKAQGYPSETPTEVKVESPSFEVRDYRGVSNPIAELAKLLPAGQSAVWREGAHSATLEGYDRYNLPAASTLVIWTAPPGPVQLRDALARTSPSTVCLFAMNPDLDRPEVFLARLAGLVKGSLNASARAARPEQAGEAQGPARLTTLSITGLAAATAQRESTVRLGLQWLAARGDVTIILERGHEIELAPGGGRAVGVISALTRRLEAVLAETAAYRAYATSAEANSVVRP